MLSELIGCSGLGYDYSPEPKIRLRKQLLNVEVSVSTIGVWSVKEAGCDCLRIIGTNLDDMMKLMSGQEGSEFRVQITVIVA